MCTLPSAVGKLASTVCKAAWAVGMLHGIICRLSLVLRNADRVVRQSALIVCRPDLVVGKLTPGRGGLSHGEVRPANRAVLAFTPTRRHSCHGSRVPSPRSPPKTASREQHSVKDEPLEDLVDGVKADLRYAEVAARERPEKLSQLGWGPRRGASALEAPGEVRDAGIRAEGEDWVVLDWKPPVDGGPAAAYTIQRRKRDGGSWRDVGTSVDTAHLLSDQPRGVEFEYRVIAVNKAGTGRPSATITVVL